MAELLRHRAERDGAQRQREHLSSLPLPPGQQPSPPQPPHPTDNDASTSKDCLDGKLPPGGSVTAARTADGHRNTSKHATLTSAESIAAAAAFDCGCATACLSRLSPTTIAAIRDEWAGLREAEKDAKLLAMLSDSLDSSGAVRWHFGERAPADVCEAAYRCGIGVSAGKLHRVEQLHALGVQHPPPHGNTGREHATAFARCGAWLDNFYRFACERIDDSEEHRRWVLHDEVTLEQMHNMMSADMAASKREPTTAPSLSTFKRANAALFPHVHRPHKTCLPQCSTCKGFLQRFVAADKLDDRDAVGFAFMLTVQLSLRSDSACARAQVRGEMAAHRSFHMHERQAFEGDKAVAELHPRDVLMLSLDASKALQQPHFKRVPTVRARVSYPDVCAHLACAWSANDSRCSTCSARCPFTWRAAWCTRSTNRSPSSRSPNRTRRTPTSPAPYCTAWRPTWCGRRRCCARRC